MIMSELYSYFEFNILNTLGGADEITHLRLFHHILSINHLNVCTQENIYLCTTRARQW